MICFESPEKMSTGAMSRISFVLGADGQSLVRRTERKRVTNELTKTMPTRIARCGFFRSIGVDILQ